GPVNGLGIELGVQNARLVSPVLGGVEYGAAGEDSDAIKTPAVEEQPDATWPGRLTTWHSGSALVGTVDAVIISGSLPLSIPMRALETAIFEAEHARRRGLEVTVSDGPGPLCSRISKG